MAQPSVAHYFNTRKRSAIDEIKVNSARKVLILDKDPGANTNERLEPTPNPLLSNRANLIKKLSNKNLEANKITNVEPKNVARKTTRPTRSKKGNDGSNRDIQELLGNMGKNERSCVTPPPIQPVPKQNKELEEIKKKICKSSRLAEMKASISRFKEGANKLKEAERKTAEALGSPRLKTFKSLELEVHLSPQKIQSPEKAYLSPKKDSRVRRNLLNILSPTKNAVALYPESPSKQILETTSKPGLKLPFQYRSLAEIFRAIDTVSQIMYNRKETITFKKLKPAVEEMLKKNLTMKHLGQIKHLYPQSYKLHQEKLKQFGGARQEEWQLVLTPTMENTDHMTAEVLLTRRRKLFEVLLDRVKNYHSEFLQSLTPPMVIPKEKITRWHPEFDIERVPELEAADVPLPPVEEKLSGREVLEKARQMFNCNTRMEQALARLQAKQAAEPPLEAVQAAPPPSLLKGVPAALLERVRQKQAAKALVSMTRSADKDKEVQMYARLPEIARVMRSLFVTEKKSVLPLEVVVEKLGNSTRCFLTKTEMEAHLRVIAKEAGEWLVFHTLRNSVFLKLARDADLSLVIDRLEKLVKEKNEA